MIVKIINSDLYRARKSKLLYGVVLFTFLIGVVLTVMNRQDIRLGVSIFGNLTTFISVSDIIRLGITYQKGLGIIAAVFISVFIGQEYQWNTWQYKWIISRTRAGIYFSKLLVSVVISVSIFLLYEIVVLLCSGQMYHLIAEGYIRMIVCGSFIYAALGSMLCLLSLLIKNSTVSVIIALGYVLCMETVFTLGQNIGAFLGTAGQFVEWIGEHTIYGMVSAVSTMSITNADMLSVILNSYCIVVIATAIGMWGFYKYEL